MDYVKYSCKQKDCSLRLCTQRQKPARLWRIFKAGETPAYYVAKMLLEEHASVFITDTKALKNARNCYKRMD